MDFDPFLVAVILTFSSAKLEVTVKVVRPEESFLVVRFASGSASIPSESITVVITLGVGATADGCAGQLLACKTSWPSQHKMSCGVGAIGEVGIAEVGIEPPVGSSGQAGKAWPLKHTWSGPGGVGVTTGPGVAVLVSVVVGDGVVGVGVFVAVLVSGLVDVGVDVGVGALKVVKFFVEVKLVPATDPFTVKL